MSETTVNIKPKSWLQTATSFKLYVSSYILNQSCSLLVHFYDLEGKVIKKESLVMEGIDFQNWGYSDDYVVDYVIRKLGLEKL